MGESSPYHYTYKDIERYHSGEMTPEEMNRMERAALDDPFLADALEGYSYTATAQEDLNKLKERLSEKTKRKQYVFWIGKNYNWLKVAAVLLFVIAGSWLLVVNRKESSTNLAINRKVDTANKGNVVNNTGYSNTPATTSADTENKNSTSLPPDELASTRRINIKKYLKDKDQTEVATSNNRLEKQSEVTDSSKAVTMQMAPSANVASARVFKAESKLSKDSSEGLIAGRGESKRNVTDTIKNLNVVMKPQAVPLSEEVVTKAKTSRKPSRSPFVIVDTLEPEDGWAEYNDYIANNLKPPEETKVKSLSGEVQLSFNVNESGRPVNIKVEKSLCEPCDTEAIRLLKEGPKWKKKKNKKGKITIHF